VELVGRELTEELIGAAYAVHNELGSGFPEKVYENAMAVELRSRKIAFRTQVPLKVKYRGDPVGEYFADMIVENSVICEFKALETAPKEAEIQLVNYLVATGIDIRLLINFGKSVTVRRKFGTHKK